MKSRITITIIALFVLAVSISTAQVTITNTSIYKTLGQMLLANEINESGEPFAEWLGYNLDDLDPAVPNKPDSISYTLGIENYEYSRYQLGTVISRSGLGLHLMWGPVIMQMAAMQGEDFDGKYTGGTPNGYKEDDQLMMNIMHFSMLANQMAPQHPWPQFAEFSGGDPHLPQAIDADNYKHDFATLRWDRSKMDKTLNPGAMGQTLMKQYLWAQDMLGAFHDSLDNGIDADGIITPDYPDSSDFDPHNNVFYGGDNLDGFIGQVLTAEAINKVKFIISNLAYDGTKLGMVNPADYNPANGILYFPTKIAVTETPVGNMMPPRATAFEVTDARSNLFDQLSLLWGTLSFKNIMDPNNKSDSPHLAYKSVFDGNPFPASMSETGTPGPFDLMMGTSKVIAMNLLAMHFNSDEGTFVDFSELNNGMPQPGNTISTVNAGYITMVLSILVDEFKGTPLEPMALNAVNAEASFIKNKLADKNGGYYNSYTLGTGPENSAKTAIAQAAAARGLYAAYVLTANNDYLTAANAAYNYLINKFYVPERMAFRTKENDDKAVYTPFNFAVIAGGLREAAVVGGNKEAAVIYTRFFKKVANGMQLSEDQATGESGNDSDGDGIPYIPEQADNLPPIFATEATLNLGTTSVETIINNNSTVTNYPNPFSEKTTLRFEMKDASHTTIDVYSADGQLIDNIFEGSLGAGSHEIQWIAGNRPQGIYFLKVRFGNSSTYVKPVIIVK